MISEFFSHVKPTNQKAKKLMITLLTIGSIITVIYILADRFKGVIGLFALVFIVGAVFVYTKYIGVEYYYDITFDSQGAPVFVVRQLSGKRQTTLCRIDLYAIVKIEKLSASQRKTHRAPAGYKRYIYLPTLNPEAVLLLTVHSPHERAEITIEAPEEFADLLAKYSIEARESRFDDEEY